MYGHFNNIIKEFLVERFGVDSWQSVLSQAQCPREFDVQELYDDAITSRILQAACTVTGLERDPLLIMAGEIYLEKVRQNGHDELLRNLGQNLRDFIDNLDYVHTYMMSRFPDMVIPSMRCEPESDPERMVCHYYSRREHLYPIVMGIFKAAGKVYFDSDVTITLKSRDVEKVAKEQNREHVVFDIVVAKRAAPQEAPPTFVAQTRKQGEKQILKDDIEHVIDRLREIKEVQGEDALPLNKSKAVQAKWKSIAKMSILNKGAFTPQYPLNLSVTTKTFCNAFPYHMVINSNMNVIHSGLKLQQLMPAIRTPTCRLEMFFDLLHPNEMDFTYENIRKFIQTPFVLRTKANKLVKWGSKPMLVLRGQMVHMESQDMVVYLASPFVRCLKDLEDRTMFLADIPIHDVTRDMLWVELMSRFHGNRGSSSRDGDLEGRDSALPHSAPGHVYIAPHIASGRPDFDPDSAATDEEGLREQVRGLRAQLDEERKRTTWLGHAFLPDSTADGLLKGERPPSGEFENVSLLFCDVVAFAQIMKACKPHDVVNLLTKLHSRFNHVVRTHSAYRVEMIGDAYLVVSGIPDAVQTHAERIANTALGICAVGRDIYSPYDYGDGTSHVKIRVGLHTGRVWCGVIGDALPRFAVFGDAVNLASRMESHGQPNRIQVSSEMYEALRDKGFELTRRGKIDVRGMKGKLLTYFLDRNTNIPESVLAGKKKLNGNEVTFINNGYVDSPPNSSGSLRSNSPLPSPFRSKRSHGSGYIADSSGAASPSIENASLYPDKPGQRVSTPHGTPRNDRARTTSLTPVN